jgi:hypothetical protein
MSDLASGLADSTNASPSVESTPQTVDSVFESAEAELSAASTTPSEPATAVPGEAPTTEASAVPPVTPEVVEGSEGPIPFKVHKTALDNARSKERDEVLAQVQQELAPIAPVLRAITQDVQSGSIDGLKQLMREYAQNPQTAALFRAEMGRALSQMRGQKPQVEEEPQADLQTADGELVYSAKQAAKREQWLMSRMKQDFSKEFAPLQDIVRERKQQQQVRQQSEQWVQRSTPLAEELTQMPGFQEHKTDILKRQAELWQQNPQTDPLKLAFRAYRDVVPQRQQAQQEKLQQSTQQSLVAQAAAKVRASTDNPAASAPAQPRRPKSVDDAFDMAIAEVGGRL